jgi:hypothetical protein
VSRFVRRAAWVAPGLLISAGALLVRDRLWLAQSVGGRRGIMSAVPAYVVLISLAVFCVLYALTFTPLIISLTHGGRGVRTPTEAELGCAVLLLRGMLIALIHGFAVYACYV